MIRGSEGELPPERSVVDGTLITTHVALNVYQQMLLQVCLDYSGVPDVRTLTMSQIRFFYRGLRSDLLERTKRTAKSKTQP